MIPIPGQRRHLDTGSGDRITRLLLVVYLLVSAGFEGFQYLFRIGAFDATDLVTNTLGGLLGLLFYFAMEKILGSPGTAQRLVNILAALGTVAVIALLLSIKLGVGPIRYQ